MLYSIYALYVKFWLHSPQGFTALILAFTFLSGVNLFFLGIIGEYIGRVYEEAKGRPRYAVRKVVGQGSFGSRVSAPRIDAPGALERTGTHFDLDNQTSTSELGNHSNSVLLRCAEQPDECHPEWQ